MPDYKLPDTGFAVRGPAGFYMIYPSKDTAQALLDKVKEKGVEIVPMISVDKLLSEFQRRQLESSDNFFAEIAATIINDIMKETP